MTLTLCDEHGGSAGTTIRGEVALAEPTEGAREFTVNRRAFGGRHRVPAGRWLNAITIDGWRGESRRSKTGVPARVEPSAGLESQASVLEGEEGDEEEAKEEWSALPDRQQPLLAVRVHGERAATRLVTGDAGHGPGRAVGAFSHALRRDQIDAHPMRDGGARVAGVEWPEVPFWSVSKVGK